MSAGEMTFVEVLELLGDGRTKDELSEELRAIVQRVQQTGRQGQLTLALKVQLASDDTVEIVDRISVRLPEFKRDPHEFLVDDEGNLRDLGRQTTIGFRVVGAQTILTEDGAIDAATGVIVGEDARGER
ncbi:hypothetical protein [Actinomyces culturomici]|uniref:hypothetical protein n=1 Tax=Actinomyces culturomici TaxID=1926276 RepID=UPI000E209A08|nr:hypothetical protein [Actinomyces culturomici]